MSQAKKQRLFYALCLMAIYYMLPLSLGEECEKTMLYVLFPTITYMIGFFAALRSRCKWRLAVVGGTLFLPAALWYFTSLAMLFAVVYGLCIFAGTLCGQAARYLVRLSRML